MTIVVPYDGTTLSKEALSRAVEFGDTLDQDLLAVTVVRKGDRSLARERGWLDSDESYDVETVVSPNSRRKPHPQGVQGFRCSIGNTNE